MLTRTLGLCLLALTPLAAAAGDISRAERLVFTDAHLSNIAGAATLRYDFRRSGTLDSALDDRLTLEVAPRADGRCCRASGSFGSPELALALPPIDDAAANPAVLYFLEQDIRAMQRRTKGQANYFRKRIRMALAEQAAVRDVTVRWNGRELAAQEVHIRPYLDDPLRSRFEPLATKHYVFTLAAEVPGGVYALRSWVGESDSPAASPLAESLTFVEESKR